MLGRQIDIWAIGITMYYIASGCLPFEGDDLIELAKKIKECQVNYSMFEEMVEGDPNQGFVKFLKKLLEKDQ
jgi:serine/threonine protein kinase